MKQLTLTNRYNYPTRFSLKIGQSVKIFYFLIIKKKRRYFNFFGFLVSKNLNANNFSIINSWGNQLLYIKFPLVCPFIYNFYRTYKYNVLNYRVSKLYFKKKVKIKDLYVNFLFHKHIIQYSLHYLLLNKTCNRIFLVKKKRKQFKKIKKKFRY